MSKTRRAHYCQRIIDKTLEEVAMGSSLRSALEKQGPLAPTVITFWRWMNEMPELKLKYEAALKFQASMNADIILDLANKVIEVPSMAPAVRVAADLRKWSAEMRDPAVYSPKGAQSIEPTKTLKQMQEEVDRLQKELGVQAQPGMVTAPRVLRERQGEAPALKVVGGKDEPVDNS